MPDTHPSTATQFPSDVLVHDRRDALGAPNADAFWADEHNAQCLTWAIQVANDLIDFDRHCVYLAWSESDILWSYEGGRETDSATSGAELVSPPPPTPGSASARMAQFKQWEKQYPKNVEFVVEPGQPSEHRCRYALVRIDADRAHGYMLLGRDGSKECPNPPPFPEEVHYLLDMVAKVLSAALGGAPPDEPGGVSREVARELLARLDLNRLHLHRRLQESPISNILREYLLKAAEVCHQLPGAAFEVEMPGRAVTVRLTAKVVNNNRAALDIRECLSTTPPDWTPERKKQRYPLPREGTPARSFAAQAYDTRRPRTTNEYQTDTSILEEYRLFPDIRCHMSAPIVDIGGDVYGVLSVETTGADAYGPVLEAAFALLAAHAAIPLKHALKREDYDRVVAVFADELSESGAGSPKQVILARLKQRLEQLGYQADIAEASDDDGTAQPVGPGVVRYPIWDTPGRVVWSVTAARTDGAHQTVEHDARLITALGSRAARTWTESRLLRLESLLYETLTRDSFFSLRSLLERVANLVTGDDPLSGGLGRAFQRARVFLVAGGEQVGAFQAGVGKVDDFVGFKLTHPDDSRILDSKPLVQPVLFIRSGHTTALPPTGEYRVEPEQPDHNEVALNNRGRSQWVEIPVQKDSPIVAKLVLDHHRGADNKSDKSPSDAFTVSEMSFVVRLSRMLSVTAEVVEAYKAVTRLCATGLHWTLFHHSLKQFATASSEEPLQVFLNKCDDSRRFVMESGDASLPLGELLWHARQAFEYFLERHKISGYVIDCDVPRDSPLRLPSAGGVSLFLVLATLAENACKATRHFHERGLTRHTSERIAVKLRATQNPETRALELEVSDWGGGVGGANDRVSRSLKEPAVFLRRGESHGLVLAAFLAHSEGWQLQLLNSENPTTFGVVIPVRS